MQCGLWKLINVEVLCVFRHCAKEALKDLCHWLHHGGEVAVCSAHLVANKGQIPLVQVAMQPHLLSVVLCWTRNQYFFTFLE